MRSCKYPYDNESLSSAQAGKYGKGAQADEQGESPMNNYLRSQSSLFYRLSKTAILMKSSFIMDMCVKTTES